MGARMSFKFKQLVEERRLVRIKPDRKLVLKEIEGAELDLETARKSLRDGNLKWATIQATTQFFMLQEHYSTARCPVPKLVLNGFYSSFSHSRLVWACSTCKSLPC